MPSAAPAHALLSAAHSLLRPAMHHGRDPPPPGGTDLLPIDEVTLPEVADLRDVVDAINRLCDNMKTSSYDDAELADSVGDETADVELSVDSQVRSVVEWGESHVTERVEIGLDTHLAPIEAEEWSENVIQDALAAGWAESVPTNVSVADDMDNIFQKVVSKGWRVNVAQENIIVEECSENVEPVEEFRNIFEKVIPGKKETVEYATLAEEWNTNVELRPEKFSNRSVLNVAPAEEWSSHVQNIAPSDSNVESFPKEFVASRNVLQGHIEVTLDVQNAASAAGNDQAALPEVGSQDVLAGQVQGMTPDVQNVNEWGTQGGQTEEVTSDGERATWDGCGSELYYTASSEVSLVSEAELGAEPGLEGRGAVAGHVAAMRERFESMTRAPTPSEHGRDHSPSPAAAP